MSHSLAANALNTPFTASTTAPPRHATRGHVLFRDTPDDGPHYSLVTLDEIGALWGIGYDPRDDAVYAGAYHKRLVPFGPGGPGAIYRIHLSTGRWKHAFTVPNAGVLGAAMKVGGSHREPASVTER